MTTVDRDPMKKRDLVFLSYAHEDVDHVREIYEGLKKRNVNTFFDKADLRPGKWHPQIMRAISRSRFFIICLSNSSIKKTGDAPSFTDTELQRAYEIAMSQPSEVFTIVPVRLEDCGRGDTRMSGFQQFDVFNDFEKELDKLAVYLGGISLSEDVYSNIILNLDSKPKSIIEKYIQHSEEIEILILKNTHIENIRFITKFTNLIKLDLSSTQVADLEPLGALTNLQELDIRNNKKVYDLSPLKSLFNLKNLYLGDTAVEDINSVKKLKNLKRLDVSNTPIKDIMPIKNLKKLEGLDISYIEIDQFCFLKELANLQRLRLRGIKLESLGPITNIENLQKTLQELDLRKAQLKDIKAIEKLKNLSTLDLRDSQVSKSQIEYLKKNNPYIDILR